VIRQPTVFILGAGASVEYGLPLGDRLIKDAADGLSETGFLCSPLLAAGYERAALDEFAQKLIGSRLTSIDAFLENNDERYQSIGKATIATTILLREKDALARLSENRVADNWLQYLWNVMRASTAADSFAGNAVTFVTFNYDRLVEYYFTEVLKNAFSLSGSEAEDLRERTFKVIHLHGAVSGFLFGAFPERLYGEMIAELAGGIRIIHDGVPANDSAFSSAYAALRSASQVCMLGFGYHPDNVKRLSLKEHVESRGLSGTTYGMRKAEVAMAKKAIDRGFTSGQPDEKCERFLREHVILE